MGNSCRGDQACMGDRDSVVNHISQQEIKNFRRDHEDDNLSEDQYILVTDLSGFTRLTKKHGPVHYISIIVRMNQLWRSYLEKFNPVKFTLEADNFIGVFDSPEDAFNAACTFVALLTEFNESIPSDREHFKIMIGGVGIAQGSDLLYDDDIGGFVGDTFREGFMFGEDLGEKDFFVTPQFGDTLFKALPETKNFFTFVREEREGFEGISFKFESTEEWCKNTIEFYPFEFPKTTDTSFIPEALIDFTRRYDSLEELGVSSIEEWDQIIFDKHVVKDAVSFLFHVNCQTLKLEQQIYKEMDTILKNFNCTKKDQTFICFSESAEAFALALVLQTLFHKYNLINFGFGIGKGDLIDVSGTHIHSGDCVNTASKIGQDCAQNGEIFMVKAVKEDLEKDGLLDNYEVTYKKRQMSKCELEFYSITPVIAE